VGTVVYMNTVTATRTNRYIVSVYDTDGKFHEVTIYRNDWRGVKTAARKVAKERGINVKFINDFFLAD
jgi:hypothetical protein